MPDNKAISTLPAALSPISGAELLPIVQDGSTVRTPISSLTSRIIPSSTVGNPIAPLSFTGDITATDVPAVDWSPLRVVTGYTAKNLTSGFDLAYLGIYSKLTYGAGATNPIGSALAATFQLTVDSSGSLDNEHAVLFGSMAYKNGARARAWFSDFNLHGPVAQQPALLNGLTMFVNNYYNGSPSAGPSAGVWVSSFPKSGGGGAPEHTTATSYALDVGIGITGFSGTESAPTTGFKVGLQIGGHGSGWVPPGQRSRVGVGISLQDIETTGIDFANLRGPLTAFKFSDNTATINWILDADARVNSFGQGAIALPALNGTGAQIRWGSDAASVALYRGEDSTLTVNKDLKVGNWLRAASLVLIGPTTIGDARLKVINDNAALITMKVRNTATTPTVNLAEFLSPAGASYARIDKNGYVLIAKTAAPADADISISEMALWLDTTAGATKLMVKAKDSAGTVRSGSLALA